MQSQREPLEDGINKEPSLNIVTQDAKTCDHKFVLRGLHDMYCEKCSWGLIIGGLSDFNKLVKMYERSHGRN